MLSKLEFYGVVAGAFLLLSGLAFGYYKYSQAEIGALKTQVAIAQDVAKSAEAVSKDLVEQTKEIAAAQAQLNQKMVSIRQTANESARAIKQRNLALQVKKDPKQVEQMINQDQADWQSRLEGVGNNAQ